MSFNCSSWLPVQKAKQCIWKKEETQLSHRCTEIEDFIKACINQETSMVSMCVVPVTVKHKNSSRQVTTFAMLENYSQGTFF